VPQSHAYSDNVGASVVSIPRPLAVVPPAPAHVSVDLVHAAQLADLRAEWIDLVAHAEVQNVFMDPALLRAAGATSPEPCLVLLAWKSIDGQRRLVGVWAFAFTRAPRSIVPVRVLTAPLTTHCYLATPVIHRDCLDETLEAMLDAIAAEPHISKTVALEMIDAEGPIWEALARVVARRGGRPCIVDQVDRPVLRSDLDGKAYLERALSGSTRKKLRQYRRRLAEHGSLRFVITSELQQVRRELGLFLAMEAAGWKGSEGTALLNKADDTAFMLAAVAALAETGAISIHSLRIGDKPVSMQIVARSGAAGFTWKTSYDEQFKDYSPGMLLLEDYTGALLADGTLTQVDSCSFDHTSFMAAWQERRHVAELWIDARRGRPLTFRVLSGMHKGYRQLRSLAKSMALARNSWSRWRNARRRSL
jgi:CelD/BcsL family acetyltransferase involved in cellulose biosynthesis